MRKKLLIAMMVCVFGLMELAGCGNTDPAAGNDVIETTESQSEASGEVIVAASEESSIIIEVPQPEVALCEVTDEIKNSKVTDHIAQIRNTVIYLDGKSSVADVIAMISEDGTVSVGALYGDGYSGEPATEDSQVYNGMYPDYYVALVDADGDELCVLDCVNANGDDGILKDCLVYGMSPAKGKNALNFFIGGNIWAGEAEKKLLKQDYPNAYAKRAEEYVKEMTIEEAAAFLEEKGAEGVSVGDSFINYRAVMSEAPFLEFPKRHYYIGRKFYVEYNENTELVECICYSDFYDEGIFFGLCEKHY